jgi:predicted amidohydrolase
MPYDLLIKNGALIDGTGQPRHRADVAIRHGRIVSIGRIREGAREVIDADGPVVAPGFIDGPKMPEVVEDLLAGALPGQFLHGPLARRT